jgi:outer membrane protein assembly factor BamB
MIQTMQSCAGVMPAERPAARTEANASSPGKFVRALPAALLLLASLLMGSASAAALDVLPTATEPGIAVRLSGSGMQPQEIVDITFDGVPIAQDRAGGAGNIFIKGIKIPLRTPPGPHEFVASGRVSGRSARVPFVVRTNWTQFRRGPFRHGENPHEVLIGPNNVSTLRMAWSRSFEEWLLAAEAAHTPVVADGILYAYSGPSDQATLHALDAKSGAIKWSQPLYGSLGLVYLSASHGRVITGAPLDNPTTADTCAYVGRTGVQSWCNRNPLEAASAVVGGTLYAVSFFYFGLDVKTGETRRNSYWYTCRSSSDGICAGDFAIADGMLYMSAQGRVDAHHVPPEGGDVWSTTIESAPRENDSSATPVIEGQTLYATASNGDVYALDRRNGAVLWSAPTGNEALDSRNSSPALAQDTLYAGAKDGAVALNALNGDRRWTRTGLGRLGSPAVANGVVYFLSQEGWFYALDSRTGATLFSRRLSGVPTYSSPVVVDGMVYANFGNKVVAFGLPR